MTEFLIEELRKAVRSADRKPLIVCGAGVATQATNGKAPSWAALIRSGIKRVEDLDGHASKWADECRNRLEAGGTPEWIAVADELTDRLGGTHNAEFAGWLSDAIGHLMAERRDLLDAIIALRCPIATTNYDDILVKATGFLPIIWSDHDETLRFLHNPTQGILHLHGYWRSPESVVLGSRSYAEHSADNRHALLQQVATLDRAALFIGCSQDGLTDPDFSRLDSFLETWQDAAPRRYWLVKQDLDATGRPMPAPSPIFTKRLFPVGFGTIYDDLPKLLTTLPAPETAHVSDPDVGLHCIEQHEPNPEIFGREGEVALVAQALLDGKPAVVAGGPGMGKTAVAIAALYDSQIMTHFGRRRVFVPLETATEPRAILAKLVEALGLSPTGDETSLLRILETSAGERPIAAILDNAGTVFDIDRAEAIRLLNLAAQTKGLSFVVTIRGSAPRISGSRPIEDLPRLTEAAARETFIAVAGCPFSPDPDLPYLLEALDGHALSIQLVAAQAGGLPSLKSLRDLWDDARAEILRRPGEEESRLTSVRASLALSLGSRRMRSTPLARRLLALLALLPGGLAEADAPTVLGKRGSVTKAKAGEAVACLHQSRLVERRPDRRLRMLTPLRECAKPDVPLLPSDRERLVDHYLSIANKAGKFNQKDWNRARAEVEAEADNLDPVCDLAVEIDASHKDLLGALNGLAYFHRTSGRATVNSLKRAISCTDRPKLRALCSAQLGAIASNHSDYEAAAAWLSEGVTCARATNDILLEATCTLDLGDVARLRSDYEVATSRADEALLLYRRRNNSTGEAHCAFMLGTIAIAHSEYSFATSQLKQALALYQRMRDTQGEANCISQLGVIALSGLDPKPGMVPIEEALALYRFTGDVLGEANCILSLGQFARRWRDYTTATTRINEAISLYRRIGDVTHEAECVSQLGLIALHGSDYLAAVDLFGRALALIEPTEHRAIFARTIVRRGQVKVFAGDTTNGIADIETGFHAYLQIADAKDRARPGMEALHRALVCHDADDRARYIEGARSAWASIGRFDLISDWLGEIPNIPEPPETPLAPRSAIVTGS
jgi:tetratricopeptide (TPR) repeat protein